MLYDKPIHPRKHVRLGYMYFCDVSHPLASKIGIVYYHRHVASEKLGRWLLPSEHVHHLDGNKCNNEWSNLAIVTASQHSHLHHGTTTPKKCLYCGNMFTPRNCKQRCCSVACANQLRYANKLLSVDPVHVRELLVALPAETVAKKLGVSGSAIVKYCRRHSLSKPPRGYWQRRKPDGTIATKIDRSPKWKHGTSLGYCKWKCRCLACEEAQENIEAAMKDSHVQHGTNEAYNRYRCRCTACRSKHSSRYVAVAQQ